MQIIWGMEMLRFRLQGKEEMIQHFRQDDLNPTEQLAADSDIQ